MAKLKVFSTPIGFHDAYVAAPSQKAALKAWGASADLFARGVAQVVTDPKLTEAPLARPGEVIKLARGTAAEHLAALPKAPPRRAEAEAKPVATPKPKPKPKPSRATLDAAERALDELEQRHAAARDALERQQATERRKVETARDRARDAYRAKLAEWEG